MVVTDLIQFGRGPGRLPRLRRNVVGRADEGQSRDGSVPVVDLDAEVEEEPVRVPAKRTTRGGAVV